MGKLNPQINTVEVGVRSVREVTVYPLSLNDQFKVSRILTKAFQEISERLQAPLIEESEEPSGMAEGVSGGVASVVEQLSDMDIVGLVAETIQINLTTILDLVTTPEEKIGMDELTNNQFYALAELIYEVNYEESAKNFLNLFKKAARLSHSKRSSPESVTITPATDSKTVSEKPSSKED